MAQTFTGSLHLTSSGVAATAAPLSMVMWVNTSGGQARRFFEICASGSDDNLFAIALDVTSGSNKVSAYRKHTTDNQALTSVALTTGAWQHVGAVFAASNSAAAYLNGGSKGTSASSVVPTGVNLTAISGRQADYSFGLAGQGAHAAAWNRALSDTEMAYLGAGGNPRAIKGLVSYWKVASPSGTPESPVSDQVGSNDLTPSATMGAGTSDPNLQTFMTGGPVGNLTYTQGTAITAVNLSAGHVFDDVSSAFTVVLNQLGTPVAQTLIGGSALSAVREFAVASSSGIAAGDYVKITSGGTPTRVLWVNGTTLLVKDDQTASASAQLYRLPINPLTVPGLSISSNSFGGTPTAIATNTLCLFRATCNANSALVADSDLITITVSSGGGGGGGSGLMLPAGIMSGGYIGG